MPSQMDMIDYVLESYPMSLLQDLISLKKTLDQHGLTIADAEHALRRDNRRQRALRLQHRILLSVWPKCPECGEEFPLVLRPADPPDSDTGYEGDPAEGSHWYCPKCAGGEYDPRPIATIMQDLHHRARRRAKKKAPQPRKGRGRR